MRTTIRKIRSRYKESLFREIFIDRNDFMEDPPKKYFRLSRKEVRLKYAYYVTCKKVIKDEDGEIKELICTYDPRAEAAIPPTVESQGNHWG